MQLKDFLLLSHLPVDGQLLVLVGRDVGQILGTFRILTIKLFEHLSVEEEGGVVAAPVQLALERGKLARKEKIDCDSGEGLGDVL